MKKFVPSVPPSTNTEPSFSNVAVWWLRTLVILFRSVKTWVVGSRSSALLNATLELFVSVAPPVISTWPVFSKFAWWLILATAIDPGIAVKLFVRGL